MSGLPPPPPGFGGLPPLPRGLNAGGGGLPPPPPGMLRPPPTGGGGGFPPPPPGAIRSGGPLPPPPLGLSGSAPSSSAPSSRPSYDNAPPPSAAPVYGGGAPYHQPRGERSYQAPGSYPGHHHHHHHSHHHHQHHYGDRSAAPYGYPRGPSHHHHHHHHHHGGFNRPSYDLRDATNTVWVGNLEPFHTDEVLRREFGRFGRVMRVARVEGKPFLFVHFRVVDEAKRAVATLTENGALGRAKFNYGKQYEYTPAEMEAPWDPNDPEDSAWRASNETMYHGKRPREEGSGYSSFNHPAGGPSFREDRPGGFGERRGSGFNPPPRGRDGPMDAPSNILWIGSLPPTLGDEEVKENFRSFGNIIHFARLPDRNMAFMHFETVEQCTNALEMMRGQSVSGHVLTLNYGKPQRNNESSDAPSGSGPYGSFGGGGSEPVTNVVYIGLISPTATHEEVDKLFEPLEGFISAKYLSQSGMAFGHFDTLEHSIAAKEALQTATLGGAPCRVTFGKSNHTLTMADKVARRPPMSSFHHHGSSTGGNEFGGGGLDPLSSGVVLHSTANRMDDMAGMLIPAMGGPASAGANPAASIPKYFTRDRAPPAAAAGPSLDSLVMAVLGTPYNQLGERERLLKPSILETLCRAIDNCVDAATEQELDGVMSLYVPLHAAHVFGVTARRLKEFYAADAHKKLLVTYAATRVLLGTKTSTLTFSRASINAFVVLLGVVAENLDSDSLSMLTRIIDKLKRTAFFTLQRLDDAFVATVIVQLGEVMERAQLDQDLGQLVKRRRKE